MRSPLLLILATALGCQTSDIELVIDGGARVDFIDADPAAPDAGPNPGCEPGAAECNNCIDDDGDGRIDGQDPHCTGSFDDDEASFNTDVPGDNRDTVRQDCFFDGDSGGGNDGCDIHICCVLDLMGMSCPQELQGAQFDPADCEPSDQCVANCEPLTPPGCDCFGCCTICNDAGCFDVLTHPAVAPDCDIGVLDDPDRCPPCSKTSSCSQPCGPDACILCPGQDEDDLPPSCDAASCPEGYTSCDVTADCLENEFCSNGCCIRTIE